MAILLKLPCGFQPELLKFKPLSWVCSEGKPVRKASDCRGARSAWNPLGWGFVLILVKVRLV
jgi:hypothetical protein